MKPTQLTVLTSASTSASSKLPCLSSIIASPPSIIPAWPYNHGRLVTIPKAREDCFDTRLRHRVDDADFPDQPPVKPLPDQEFRLFAALAVIVLRLVCPVPLPHDRPVHLVEACQIVEPFGESRQAVPVGKDETFST